MINYRVLYRTRFFFCKKMVREYVRYVYNDKNIHKKYINMQKEYLWGKASVCGTANVQEGEEENEKHLKLTEN